MFPREPRPDKSVIFLYIQTPLRFQMLGVFYLAKGPGLGQDLDRFTAAETEVPTYLLAHASAFVPQIHLYIFVQDLSLHV